MWRSKARAFLLRSPLRTRHQPQIRPQVPSQTLTLALAPKPSLSSSQSCTPLPRFPNPRFFSSASQVLGPDGNGGADENPDAAPWDLASGEPESWNFEESEGSPLKFEGLEERVEGDFSGFPGVGSEESNEGGGENLSYLWEASVNGEDQKGAFSTEEVVGVVSEEAQVPELDVEQVEKVVSLLRSTPQESIRSSLEKLEFNPSYEFVTRVLQSPDIVGENLIIFFVWAVTNNASVKTRSAIELLVQAVCGSNEVRKMAAYMFWDVVQEVGKEEGFLSTEILNQLIAAFWKLGKAKAGLEVFEKFEEFGCVADGNSYYYTIEALGKRSMVEAAWSVCEKMLSSGRLPDDEKIGRMITFFCKGKKVKEAHSVYLTAKESKITLPRSSLDFLIGGLVRNDETVWKAFELLEDYPVDSLKYANGIFGSVVRGLCRIKDVQEAKKLLLRMVESGPPPGNAVFNYVITALSKEGDMEDAIALIKVMEGRGLRPDIYTYSVIMSGYAKGGLMVEAHKIFSEAKKTHPKLSPVTYHILTRGYCKMEEFEKALECLREMKEDGVKPTADEYNKIIQSLCLKALDWRTAEKLMEEMKESGLHLKGMTRSLIAAVKELEEEEEVQSEVSVAG